MTYKKLSIGLLLAITITFTITSTPQIAFGALPTINSLTVNPDDSVDLICTDPLTVVTGRLVRIDNNADFLSNEVTVGADGDLVSIVCDGLTTNNLSFSGNYNDFDVINLRLRIFDGSPAASSRVDTTFIVADNTNPIVTGSITNINNGGNTELTNIDQYTESCTSIDNDPAYVDSCTVQSGSIDTSITGLQSITYEATDTAGNTGTDTISTTIIDTTNPVLTLNGIDPETVFITNPYVDAGATVSDNDSTVDGNIIACDASSVDVNIAGSYTVFCDFTDPSGNIATQITRTVNVIDNIAPVITLFGANPQTIFITSPYVELGAVAIDVNDGDITANIIIDSSAIDVNTVGSYPVTYDVTDSAGNPAIQVVRTVNIVDNIAPVITLLGDPVVDIPFGGTFTDDGATASDVNDGDITGSIVVGGDVVDTFQQLSTFVITYDVSDSSGNAATQVTRTVNIAKAPTRECINCQQPSIGETSDGRRVVDNGILIGGDCTSYACTSYDAKFYYTPIPLIQTELGEKLSMKFVIWDDVKNNIIHVELGLGKGKVGESFKKEGSMIWNRNIMNNNATVTFDDTMFEDVSMKMVGQIQCREISHSETCDLFEVSFRPIKAIVEDTVFGLNVWDSNRNAMTTFFNDGLQVGTEEDVIPEPEFVVVQGNGNRQINPDSSCKVTSHGFDRNCPQFKMMLEGQQLIAESVNKLESSNTIKVYLEDSMNMEDSIKTEKNSQ